MIVSEREDAKALSTTINKKVGSRLPDQILIRDLWASTNRSLVPNGQAYQAQYGDEYLHHWETAIVGLDSDSRVFIANALFSILPLALDHEQLLKLRYKYPNVYTDDFSDINVGRLRNLRNENQVGSLYFFHGSHRLQKKLVTTFLFNAFSIANSHD